MSQNQSRSETRESSQYRKTGRSGSFNQQQRGGKGGGGGGGGGTGSAPPPSSSSSSNPPLSSSRSFNKKYNNVQGGQSRATGPNLSLDSTSVSTARAVQNGTHQQQQLHDVPSTSPSTPVTSGAVKQADVPSQKIIRAVPRAPTSNVSTAGSETITPSTPAKASGDAAKSFPLQFGSISPGFMNGMQIPARTSSAPPNLDEQKRAQARQDSSKGFPAMPAPSTVKQPLSRKEAGAVEPSITGEIHQVKSKKDVQVSAPAPTNQTQKPTIHSIAGVPMQMQFHQAQVPVQFGGPSAQIQSQAMSATSLPMPMPMPLPLGNAPVQQPMFVSGLQPHPMQSQGLIHQGQSLNFSSAMAPQMPPQLGNMGINMAPQFPQQQAANPRKAVKITHPETHEELRLDGSSGSRSRSNMPPQSQPIPSYPSGHPIGYYPSTYSSSSLFYPSQSSIALNNSQLASVSQPPRFYNQVTVKPATGAHGEKDMPTPAASQIVGKGELKKSVRSHTEDSVPLQKESEASSQSSSQQLKSSVVPTPASKPIVSKQATVPASVEDPVSKSLSSACPLSPEKSASLSVNGHEDKLKCEIDSNQDQQKEPTSEELSSPPDQGGKTHTSVLTLSSESLASDTSTALNTVESETSPVARGKESSSLHTATSGLLTAEDGQNLELGAPEALLSEPHKAEEKESHRLLPEETETLYFSETSSENITMESLEVPCQSREKLPSSVICEGNEGGSTETAAGETEAYSASISREDSHAGVSVTSILGENLNSNTNLHNEDGETSTSGTALGSSYKTSGEDPAVAEHGSSHQEMASLSGSLPSQTVPKHGNQGKETIATEKSLLDPSLSKSTMTRVKKKKTRDLCKKADQLGASDLYMAYKGPEEKKEAVIVEEAVDNSSVSTLKTISGDSSEEEGIATQPSSQNKVELEDWEDAADISTPKLESSKGEKQVDEGSQEEATTKKYSRDFLMKFAEQCVELPEGFEITSDLADALKVRDSYPSPGRVVDRPIGGSRLDRRGSTLGDDDKWNKVPGPLPRDLRLDINYGGSAMGFRPGQGGNSGVLRNPRGQIPMQYAGGILAGPMQSLGPQAGAQRNGADADRWQRGTAFQKGLMPSPQTPLQVMHRAEKKYEVGKVTDEEQAKQRQLKSILNKLTPQNFEKLFEQVKQVNIDNVVTLTGVIGQIFDKALMEPTFCEMYANFCLHLADELPDLSIDKEKITFKRLLLNKCQEEFERGEREEEEANKAAEEGEAKLSDEEREEKRVKARRRTLGNIRLIGELYKKKMLTERIMHECIKKLLGQYQNPDEENIEALCKLMSTIGEMIDHEKAKEHMDAYFDMMLTLSNNMKLSSRVRFMLKDAIDLRKNKWQQRRKVEGPKKIEEVHRDAAQERQGQASRLSRAPSLNASARRGQPMDFGPRGSSMLPSPGSQMGGFRPVSPSVRAFNQDVRLEERHSFENRTLSVPLSQRLGDDAITLGPQGGLARGMSFRGQTAAPSIPSADQPSPGESRRVGPGLNGYSSLSERTGYGSRDDLTSRYMAERFVSPSGYDQSSGHDRSFAYGNRDRSFDMSPSASLPARGGTLPSTQSISAEKVWPEERLRNMSMAAIKEFYSARDENEVALCIKDLNAPSFHSSMISIWVTDSFERKDMERDLLAKLLTSLTKSHDGMINQDQLVKGFEDVLASLEDAVNDAPKAAEFLGRIFAFVVLENVVPLTEIGRLIYEGGEEQGRLVEIGLAAEVLGSTLEMIRAEKGDSTLMEIRRSSNLRLENFRPPGSNKQLKLDKFI